MRIALFQPDIPQNTGTILRLCACLDVEAHIIEPAGFPVSDRHFRRAGMDYLDQVSLIRHNSWSKFEEWRQNEGCRLILLTTKGLTSYFEYRYAPSDVLMLGRESRRGSRRRSPQWRMPGWRSRCKPGLRSLNIAVAAAMVVGEALRQTVWQGER